MTDSRKIILSEDINSESVREMIEQIIGINHLDDIREDKTRPRDPIHFYINSGGGGIYNGFALVDTILSSETPIYTYCMGHAMSMAFIIYLCGHQRYAFKNCTFMNHSARGFYEGCKQDIEHELNETQRLDALCDKIITDRTLIEQETLDEFYSRKQNWYISADEALVMGICHEIM